MRTLSIVAFASFLTLWGIYSFMNKEDLEIQKVSNQKKLMTKYENKKQTESLSMKTKRSDLDKIGNVINEKNVNIDIVTKNEIKSAKIVFEAAQNLKEKQGLLEQSYMDRASSIKDIKHLQNKIVDIRNKAKTDALNTEKWDPKFIYYLMLQENYTYQEINNIKSLSDNGFNSEELNYINEQIKEASFEDRIKSLKGQGEIGRATASLMNKLKEKDDFINNSEVAESRESKIVEMNYNQDDKEERTYVKNQ